MCRFSVLSLFVCCCFVCFFISTNCIYQIQVAYIEDIQVFGVNMSFISLSGHVFLMI